MNEKKGYFFLPKNLDNTDSYIPGIIKINTAEITEITLFDSLHETGHLFTFDEPEDLFTVWGILENGDKVSLLSTQFSEGTKPLSGSGIPSLKYKAKHCLIKTHIIDSKEKKFFKAVFSIQKFQRWHGKFGGQSQIEMDDSSIAKFFRFEYQYPSVLTYQIEDQINLRISFTVNHPHKFGEYLLKQITEVIIESEEDVSLHAYLEKISIFKNLFSLVIGENAILTDLSFNDRSNFYENPEFNIPKQYIKVNYHSSTINSLPSDESKPRQYSVNFLSIEPIYETVLKTWYQKNQLIAFRNIVSICVNSLNSKDKFDPTQFIAMFQAIEGFHRNFSSYETSTVLKDKEMLESILKKDLEESEKEWLRDKFKNGFEINARQRLKELFKKYGLLLSPSLPKKYYKKVVNDILLKRNKLTHMDENYDVSHFLDVYQAYHHLLKRLLMLLILEETGVSENVINKGYFKAMDFNLNYYDTGCGS